MGRVATEKNDDLNVIICMEMKQDGQAFKIQKMVHNYPHCWRTDKPILYYPLDSWFIRDTAKKQEMVALNKTIHWLTGVNRHRTFRQLAGEPQRLEPLPFTFLGNATAYLARREPS